MVCRDLPPVNKKIFFKLMGSVRTGEVIVLVIWNDAVQCRMKLELEREVQPNL